MKFCEYGPWSIIRCGDNSLTDSSSTDNSSHRQGRRQLIDSNNPALLSQSSPVDQLSVDEMSVDNLSPHRISQESQKCLLRRSRPGTISATLRMT
jgi:hypothetical protein